MSKKPTKDISMLNEKGPKTEIIQDINRLGSLELIGEIKHRPPANKEWTNSVYTYNKSYLKSLPAKDSMANKLIKGHFYLSSNKTLARSKRMRNLIRKSTSKKLFVSKPEIKQTNDKVIITVYTLNKEKQFLVRKLFFYNRQRNLLDFWRKNNSHIKNFNILSDAKNLTKQNLITKHGEITVKKQIKLKLKRQSLFMSKIVKTKLKKLYRIKNLEYFFFYRSKINKYKKRRKNMFKRRLKRFIPYSGIKLKNEMKFLSFKLLAKEKQFMAVRRLFYYYFLKYALSIFNIKLSVFKPIPYYILEKKGKNKKVAKPNLSNINSALSYISRFTKSEDGKVKIYFYVNKFKYTLNLDMKDKFKQLENKSELEKFNFVLSNINFMISKFLSNILAKSGINNIENKIYFLFNNFCKKNYLIFLSSSLKKEVVLANNYVKLMVNRFKFGKFLPGLKLLISKIYSKKTELNIVNLKYSHLNTDIYTDSVALKLRKKLSLLKVLRKAIQLVKTPYRLLDISEVEKQDLNVIHKLNTYKSLKLNRILSITPLNDIINKQKYNNVSEISPETDYLTNNELSLSKTLLKSFDETLKKKENESKIDILQRVLKKLYPYSLVNGSKSNSNIVNLLDENNIVSNKLMNVLNSIKYKWVTGARLEAAGRLTRRYTASRSVFKFKYRGSLKNIDYSKRLEYLNKSVPTIMLRNQVKANSQYTSTNSKRRIGAFGLKGWIGGY